MEEKGLPIIFDNDKKGCLFIKDFDSLKNVVVEKLKDYVVLPCLTADDYKTAKSKRAELNNIAKMINDTKIRYVKDTTLTLTSQCKELCELIEEKSRNYDTEAKIYEIEQLNKEVKIKQGSFDISIHCNSREEFERVKKVLDTKKFIKYSVKENN